MMVWMIRNAKGDLSIQPTAAHLQPHGEMDGMVSATGNVPKKSEKLHQVQSL